MESEERQLGDVWKDRAYKARYPWLVKTSSGVAAYVRKRDAVAIGELFKRERDRLAEEQRTVS